MQGDIMQSTLSMLRYFQPILSTLSEFQPTQSEFQLMHGDITMLSDFQRTLHGLNLTLC